MKKSFFKNLLLPTLIFVIVAISMSSCQRGYGCPYKMQSKMEAKK